MKPSTLVALLSAGSVLVLLSAACGDDAVEGEAADAGVAADIGTDIASPVDIQDVMEPPDEGPPPPDEGPPPLDEGPPPPDEGPPPPDEGPPPPDEGPPPPDEGPPPPDEGPPPPDEGPLPPLPTGKTLFRLTGLGFVSPALIWPGGGDITELVAAVLATMFADLEDPTDIVLVFKDPEPMAEEVVPAAIGTGSCTREAGEIVACALLEDPPPASFDAVMALEGGCPKDEPSASAPCFASIPGAIEGAAIQVGPYQLGLSDVSLSGTFASEPPEQQVVGVLSGFLPQKIAETVAFQLPGGAVVALDDLLSGAIPGVVNGQSGWWVDLSFQATQEPLPAP